MHESHLWETAKNNYEDDLVIATCEKLHLARELYVSALMDHADCVSDEHKIAFEGKLNQVRNYQIEDCDTLPIDLEIYEFVDHDIDLDDDGVIDFTLEYYRIYLAFNWDQGECRDELTDDNTLCIYSQIKASEQNEILVDSYSIHFLRLAYDVRSDEQIFDLPFDAHWSNENFIYTSNICRLKET